MSTISQLASLLSKKLKFTPSKDPLEAIDLDYFAE